MLHVPRIYFAFSSHVSCILCIGPISILLNTIDLSMLAQTVGRNIPKMPAVVIPTMGRVTIHEKKTGTMTFQSTFRSPSAMPTPMTDPTAACLGGALKDIF